LCDDQRGIELLRLCYRLLREEKLRSRTSSKVREARMR
jgi:hypothetical protein